MPENTEKCFANCMKTRRGEHLFFRSFGLNVTDRIGRLTRADVLSQIEAYYPNVEKVNITQISDTEYTIELVGDVL